MILRKLKLNPPADNMICYLYSRLEKEFQNDPSADKQ